jgi:hypothetical protein
MSIGNDRRLINSTSDDVNFGASSITLADLNGDGIPDLVAANGGTGRVLVYLGLGDGQFGSELNGGAGFGAGSEPVGVSVADVNGDGRPDLIVANELSNDVSILINTVVSSNALGGGVPSPQFTFEPGATINSARAPVSAVMGSYSDGGRYLAVADSASNDVTIFPEGGNGTFSATPAQVIPLGTSPALLVPMQWNGQSALLSLDSNDNAISLITGLGTADTHVQTIDSGGLDPVAAESFSAGGTSGLVVANSGDGSVAIFVETPSGLVRESSFADSRLRATAFPGLVGARNLGVFVFVPNSDARSSTLFGFSVIGGNLTPTSDTVFGLSPQQQLQPLRQADLALVSTLLPVSAEVGPIDGRAAILTPAPTPQIDGLNSTLNQVGRGNAAGQNPALVRSEDAGSDTVADPGTKLSAVSPPASAEPPWEKYVSGVDAAIEQLHQERIERGTSSPSAAEENTALLLPAGAVVSARSEPAPDDSAVAASTMVRFELGELNSLAGPDLIENGSGPEGSVDATAAVGRPAHSEQRASARPVRRDGGESLESSERRNRRSIGLSAVVAAAAIAPSVFGKWLHSKHGKRNAARLRRRDGDLA